MGDLDRLGDATLMKAFTPYIVNTLGSGQKTGFLETFYLMLCSHKNTTYHINTTLAKKFFMT